ncbi:MAG: histidine kinase [Clostridiaceae bacterium]|nr:histidine kinase [Clostridiaceae bacterium]
MEPIFGKLVILVMCLVVYLPGTTSVYAVIPVIAAFTFSALNSWLEHENGHLAIFLLYTAACFFDPGLIYFLPLLSFDLYGARWQAAVLLSFLPLLYQLPFFTLPVIMQWVLQLFLAWFFKKRSLAYIRMRQEMTEHQDAAREASLQLEQKNKELLEKQDYEINLATLNERNRIARDMHDHVGHLLTRAILQAGALMAADKDEAVHGQLQQLKDTLVESMDNIRQNLHDLHDPVIDLQAELTALVRDFQYCPVRLTYSVEQSPDKKCKFAFLAISREALANIMRHSQATQASITVLEHPGFYQMIIKDNGIGPPASLSDARDLTVKVNEGSDGMGLKSMAERIESLNGHINIRKDRGFVLFISVPKSGKDEEREHGFE